MRIAFVALFCSACMTFPSAVRLETGPPRPPVHVDSVRIYRTLEQVPPGYVEVALVDTKGWSYESEAQLIESLRREAAKLGANALVLDANPPPATSEKPTVNVNRWTAPRARALAIWIEKR